MVSEAVVSRGLQVMLLLRTMGPALAGRWRPYTKAIPKPPFEIWSKYRLTCPISQLANQQHISYSSWNLATVSSILHRRSSWCSLQVRVRERQAARCKSGAPQIPTQQPWQAIPKVSPYDVHLYLFRDSSLQSDRIKCAIVWHKPLGESDVSAGD
ncbi:hypothetical protein BGX38DRAFT_1173617 [Terfezia claveryi]|nr:hypothetical protein BGX38DRAFT_1173617 [Terfezia claveryi]